MGRTDRTLRRRVAVVGIGETTYYRHGASPDAEFKLALKAILAACDDAGLDPRDIDGFASYSGDQAGSVRMVGHLLGDPLQTVSIGAEVEGVFEHHSDSDPPYSLLHWQAV